MANIVCLLSVLESSRNLRAVDIVGSISLAYDVVKSSKRTS